jgi:hypothetical protein
MAIRKGKQNVNSKKTVIDGIEFQSRLESYAYVKLKELGIEFQYEERSFTLIDGFTPKIYAWESIRDKFIPRLKKVLPITYKPDFTCPNMTWVIEVKGRANELFPMRWKLFKRYLNVNSIFPELFLPHDKKEIDIAVQWIKDNQQK